MLTLDQISIEYQTRPLLDHISLTLGENEILCLLGTSGSGKTTLLRIIAGLEDGYRGDVLFRGNRINHLPPHRRNFSLMFQDYALFPHMNVFENVAFGLRMKGIKALEVEKRVTEMLDMIGLQEFRKREISRLSGGEKQRVALARSLATRPDLLMLDEPLGALDAALREHLLDETRQIIRNLGIGTIYVTHDQQEAYAIADRIAILNQGRMEQIDTPLQVYKRPRTRFVAEFLGLQNVVRADVFQDRLPLVKTRFALLHPDGLHVADQGQLTGRVIHSKFRGDQITVQVMTDEGIMLHFGIPSTRQAEIVVGEPLRIAVDPDYVVPLAEESSAASD